MHNDILFNTVFVSSSDDELREQLSELAGMRCESRKERRNCFSFFRNYLSEKIKLQVQCEIRVDFRTTKSEEDGYI